MIPLAWGWEDSLRQQVMSVAQVGQKSYLNTTRPSRFPSKASHLKRGLLRERSGISADNHSKASTNVDASSGYPSSTFELFDGVNRVLRIGDILPSPVNRAPILRNSPRTTPPTPSLVIESDGRGANRHRHEHKASLSSP